eukprot:g45140.t1
MMKTDTSSASAAASLRSPSPHRNAYEAEIQALQQNSSDSKPTANGEQKAAEDAEGRKQSRGKKYGSNVHRIKNMFLQKMGTTPNEATGIPAKGKERAVRLSLPRASSLNENVDHSALLKLGTSVSERVSRFDTKTERPFSKLQETRKLFEKNIQEKNVSNRILLKKERAGLKDSKLDVVVRFNGSTESLDSLETEAISPTVSQLSAVFESGANQRKALERGPRPGTCPLSSKPLSRKSKLVLKNQQEALKTEGGSNSDGDFSLDLPGASGQIRKEAEEPQSDKTLGGSPSGNNLASKLASLVKHGDSLKETRSIATAQRSQKVEEVRKIRPVEVEDTVVSDQKPGPTDDGKEDPEPVLNDSENGTGLQQGDAVLETCEIKSVETGALLHDASSENGDLPKDSLDHFQSSPLESAEGTAHQVEESLSSKADSFEEGEQVKNDLDLYDHCKKNEDVSEADMVDISAFSGVGDESEGSCLDDDEDDAFEPESGYSEITGLSDEEEPMPHRKIRFSTASIKSYDVDERIVMVEEGQLANHLIRPRNMGRPLLIAMSISEEIHSLLQVAKAPSTMSVTDLEVSSTLDGEGEPTVSASLSDCSEEPSMFCSLPI